MGRPIPLCQQQPVDDNGSDGVGNITQRSVTIGGVTSVDAYALQPGANRLTGIVTDSVPSRGFQSDLAGNITEDATVSPALTKAYTYNAAGQLASAAANSTTTGDYVYDYLSRLVSRTNHTVPVTLTMVHDLDGNVIAEYDSTGALLTEYVWIDGRPLAMIADAGASPTLYFILTDHLERPVMMTDENRAIVWQASYLPFGEVRTITGTANPRPALPRPVVPARNRPPLQLAPPLRPIHRAIPPARPHRNARRSITVRIRQQLTADEDRSDRFVHRQG